MQKEGRLRILALYSGMTTEQAIIRAILGFKVRELRLKAGLSPKELSAACGLSQSYLNEIEKGKKYPKGEKMMALAAALDTDYDSLISLKVSKTLRPIVDVIRSEFFKQLPMEHFGLDLQSIMELLSASPQRIQIFLSTLVEMARYYDVDSTAFHLMALRTLQESQDNYFPALEEKAKAMNQALKSPKTTSAKEIKAKLEESYGVSIEDTILGKKEELKNIRSVWSDERKTLYLHPDLSPAQQKFMLARELYFQSELPESRPSITPTNEPEHFETAMENFNASYFAAALTQPEDVLLDKLSAWLKQKKWKSAHLEKMLKQLEVTPEMLMQRMTNLLPKHFGLKNLFFLRFVLSQTNGSAYLTKELHLARLHDPHANNRNEHYCRRWISIETMNQLLASTEKDIVIGAQISSYIDTKDQYLCLSIAFRNATIRSQPISVTIGFLIDKNTREQVGFLNDPAIKTRIVHTTCEHCPIMDCKERVAEPNEYLRLQRIAKQDDLVRSLIQRGTVD